MWPDLGKVPFFAKKFPLVDKLPRVYDRLKASLFFIQEAGNHTATMNDASNWRSRGFSWMSWSAMVALSAAREAIDDDLDPFKLKHEYGRSDEIKEIRDDPIIAILNELRNYAVHYDFHPTEEKEFRAIINDTHYDFGKYPFFAPIDWKEFRQVRNIRQHRSPITEGMVEWFNKQTATWPVIHIISVGGERLEKILSRFLVREMVVK